jgi:metallo-beta-lactamase class B
MKLRAALLAAGLAPAWLCAQIVLIVTQIPASTPAGSTLYVAGNFNGWNPAGSPMSLVQGEWRYTVPAGSGTLEFKFTRGSWATVEGTAQGGFRPNRSHAYGNGDTLRLQVEGWEDLGGGSGSTANGQVQVYSTSFYMPQLNRSRRVWVYLPLAYSDPARRFPVLYMQDGQNVFDAATSFSGEWEVDETLARLEQAGDSGIIVVAIDNGGSERLDEYSPWVNSQYGGGEGEAYADFIAQTLKPHIDSQFRTQPDRRHTGIMGSSMGGLISLYAALRHPGVFSRVGALSPSLWFSDSVYRFVSTAIPLPGARAYFLAGGQEPAFVAANNQRMRDSLLVRGYAPEALSTRVVAGGQHSEWFWRQEFEDAYRFLFRSGGSPASLSPALAGISLGPNPAESSLSLSTPLPIELLLMDSAGRELLRKSLMPGQHSLELPQLSPGIYLLRMQAGDAVRIERWIKE